ncbi:tripartite tricarboxylate transporter substrate-binding protein [Falsiroseomonas oryziterrae]|uniref:tripartite tricarboxylate transporter substrate-binding protein n=1 Tax=Falsiroseomonas oryziterrae TaxID=2911368 RepID=UPI001F424131|nr:tripartite tricarboxylate transporter substrate-binding protein [Roseomonas sp. NPKOSM-4]
MTLAIRRRAALGLGAALALPGLAQAQVVQRNARVVIGFPAGGSSDVVARLYAERLRGIYAPNLIVDGRVGAAGRIAVEHVRDADRDGTVYLQTPASMLTLQPHVFPREVRYDALTDLIPVSTVCTFPFTLAVPASHPARTFDQLVAWLRAQTGEIPFASPAAGSAPHFLGVMLANALRVRMTHVPYRGAVPAVQDLVGGRLPVFVGVLGDVSPQHGQGARMLAVTSEARNPRFPDVPTFRELGHPDLSKDEWFGALLPAGTPAPIVQGLHAAITQVARQPEMMAALERLEFSAGTSASPQAFADRIRRERDEWGPVVRASGFQPEN